MHKILFLTTARVVFKAGRWTGQSGFLKSSIIHLNMFSPASRHCVYVTLGIQLHNLTVLRQNDSIAAAGVLLLVLALGGSLCLHFLSPSPLGGGRLPLISPVCIGSGRSFLYCHFKYICYSLRVFACFNAQFTYLIN